ncbi:MAG: hypothetical protein KKF46_04970 [Nanoarchaeota archaeon]|nr:hypothetical protein [Nanoarchaeota archaeon]MBU1321685.1 hypothetical protein [Nanoarchaeota archaeon]MBU1598074.1 hypothetical protein [Nanoarchaeota archaeon]MBU2441634.1 hypothetical protein [Nanoarchaeota archaeon]
MAITDYLGDALKNNNLDSNQFNFADINVSKKIGPGRLSLGLVGANGRVYDVNIMYSASVKF